MEGRYALLGTGSSLVVRLYLLLAAVFLPTLVANYFNSMRLRESFQTKDLDAVIISIASIRLEGWLQDRNLPDMNEAERGDLGRELYRITQEPNGIEGLSVFYADGSGELKLLAKAESTASPARPSLQDQNAVRDDGTIRQEFMRGDHRFLSVSVPLHHRDKDQPRGVIHLQVQPDNFENRFSDWQQNLLWSAAATLVVIGVCVAAFFHFSVRKPIVELVNAMKGAAEGNLSALVEPRSGEFGWVSSSYNQMMRRLKSSVDQNRGLLVQIQRFNEELTHKVEAATSELAAKNAQLQEANEKLFLVQRQMSRLEKLATIGHLSTTIAHELGTPLNAISGHLQLLEDEPGVDPRVSERLKIIGTQVDRLIGIVRDVVRTMRMPPPRFETFSVNQVVKTVFELVAPIVQKNSIRCDLRLQEDLPQISGDPDQIGQVLMNLLTNAMDAMSDGGTLGVATSFVAHNEAAQAAQEPWSALEGGSYLRLDVSDTGSGMDEETAGQAFEPFFTTKRGTSDLARRSGLGIGLGLAICREIVKNHHGEIFVRSERGKGTTFTVMLPVEPVRVEVS